MLLVKVSFTKNNNMKTKKTKADKLQEKKKKAVNTKSLEKTVGGPKVEVPWPPL